MYADNFKNHPLKHTRRGFSPINLFDFYKKSNKFPDCGRSSLNNYRIRNTPDSTQAEGNISGVTVRRCREVTVSVVLYKTTKVFLFFKMGRIIKNGKNDKKKKNL